MNALYNTAQAVKSIALLIVQKPERVRVELIERNHSAELKIECDPSDNRHLIGSRGAHWKAMRDLVQMANLKLRPQLFLLPIVDGSGIRINGDPEFSLREDWPVEKITKSLIQIGKTIFSEVESIEERPMGKTDTMLVMHVCANAPESVLRITSEALGKLFKAVGTRQGRFLTIEIVPDVDAPGHQPASNEGRDNTAKVRIV